MKKINLIDIAMERDSYEVVLDKAGRVVDGISHGRTVLKGDGVYYKIFDMEYCRRENFIKAYEDGFFDEIAPALKSLIVDGYDKPLPIFNVTQEDGSVKQLAQIKRIGIND